MEGAAIGGAVGVAGTLALTAGVSAIILENRRREGARSSGGEDNEVAPSIFYLGAGAFYTPFLSALAIWQGGRSSGGNANYGLTLLGTFMGAVVGSGSSILLFVGTSLHENRNFEVFNWVAPLIGSLFRYGGGLLAYHFSDKARAAHRAREHTWLLEPYITRTRAGFSAGLSGHF